MCGESRTHGFEAEGKKATSGSTVTATGKSKEFCLDAIVS
ncbi:hypothetical protein CKA32_001300 [Geitlerinema sp. FC II]|nr:hypothetical protein CKA32_001300 [Geitlerinema sp. FC II]